MSVEKAEGMESLTVITTGTSRQASIDAATQRGCLAGETGRASVSSDFSTLFLMVKLADRCTQANLGSCRAA